MYGMSVYAYKSNVYDFFNVRFKKRIKAAEGESKLKQVYIPN